MKTPMLFLIQIVALSSYCKKYLSDNAYYTACKDCIGQLIGFKKSAIASIDNLSKHGIIER